MVAPKLDIEEMKEHAREMAELPDSPRPAAVEVTTAAPNDRVRPKHDDDDDVMQLTDIPGMPDSHILM